MSVKDMQAQYNAKFAHFGAIPAMHRRGGKQREYSFKNEDYGLDMWENWVCSCGGRAVAELHQSFICPGS